MSMTFSSRTALVTGAAGGIGLAVATHLAERGARVVGVDISDRIKEVTDGLTGEGHHAITADLTREGAATEAVLEAVDATGQVDILVNSAGVALLDKAVDLSLDKWNATMALNLTASFTMAQAAGRHMTDRGYGRIINLASQASVIGLDQHVAYCTSKAGIVGMTKAMSLEWAPAGVTVNAVSPTVVETELGKKAWAGQKGEDMKKLIPAGRFAQPEEVAAMIGYLASDDAGMVTGENMLIDGGYSAV